MTIERKGKQTIVESPGLVISPTDHQALSDSMDNNNQEFYPDHPIAIGEEWTPKVKAYLKTFSEAKDFVSHFKLLGFTLYSGHRCAHIQGTVNFTYHIKPNKVMMGVKCACDVYIATDLNRQVAFTMTGPLQIMGREKMDGIAVRHSGAGTLTIKGRTEWLKVDGKPVVQNGVDTNPM